MTFIRDWGVNPIPTDYLTEPETPNVRPRLPKLGKPPTVEPKIEPKIPGLV